MLKLKNITKYYDKLLAVDNLSFDLKKGEIFGLLGVNGAGKTTTFRMIMGLMDPSSGEITLDGKKIDYKKTDEIGFLTEERSLLTKLTVKEQAIFYGRLKSMDEETILERLDSLLKKFEIIDYKNKKIKELSKGNQQKIQFILAIINKPKLLILDEPFSGLDPFNIELFKNEIKKLSSEGTAIIFSTHRMDHVELFCKKIAVIMKGKVVLEGNIDEIKKTYRKKNITLKADYDIEELSKIKGVTNIETKSDEIVLSVENTQIIDDVFNKVKKYKNVTKFLVEEPSLNEIFIEKVGESFEK